MNSNLLKEAIADAKAVRATALANAKAALEEAFNARFESVFSEKLREDSVEDVTQNVAPVAEAADKDSVGATKPSKSNGTKGWSKDNKGNFNSTSGQKNLTPNTIPAAKDGGDATKGWSKDNKGNAFDGTPNGVKENADVSSEEESVEETVTNEDLEEIIRELESEASDVPPADDPSAGPSGAGDEPPVAGPETETPAEDAQEIKAGDTVTITGTVTKAAPEGAAPDAGLAPEAPGADGGIGGESPSPEAGGEEQPPMEEEIDLNELLASLNEEAKEDSEEKSEEKDEKKDDVDETVIAQLNEVTSQRDEAYRTVAYLKSQINEINLLNAKLLYTNKLFKEFGMNRDQKTRVVESFDLAKNVREVKLTYANWNGSLNFGGNFKKKAPAQSVVTTLSEGLASKPVASTKPAAIITESCNAQAQRFQKLAGINVKK